MNERVCGSCQAAIASDEWRLLPTPSDGNVIDLVVCETCWPQALAATHSYIAAGDPEEF